MLGLATDERDGRDWVRIGVVSDLRWYKGAEAASFLPSTDGGMALMALRQPQWIKQRGTLA